MFDKLFIDLIQVPFKVGISGDMSAGVGEKEVGHFRETGSQSFPESLQLRVLLFLHFQLF